MTNIQRLKQLKSYGIKRHDLVEEIPKINKEILTSPEIKQSLEKYIKNALLNENFSIEFLEKLFYKLKVTKWMYIPKNLGIYEMFYSLMVEKILLPNYTDWWLENDRIQEIQSIVEDTIAKVDKELQKTMQGFYYVWIWDKNTYPSVVELLIEIDEEPSFHVGHFFWCNILRYDDNNSEIITMEISLRTGKKIKSSLSDEETSHNTIHPETLKKALENILSSKGNKAQKWIAWFPNYDVKVKKWIIDNDWRYGNDANDVYTVITLSTDRKANIPTLSKNELANTIDWLFQCNNYVINELIKTKWNPNDFEKIYHNMSVWTLLSHSQNTDELSQEDKEKFNKLLVKDDKKTYLSDVWGQQKAKKEIEKIILAIKHEEIMRSWGAKTTSGIVFEWPAGTGKTLLAKTIATEVQAETYNIKITDLLNSSYINEWALNVRNMFKYLKSRAKNRRGKLIVILDELDALFIKRNGKSDSEDRKVVNTFLSELSWFEECNNVIFIGTTNLYQELDEAVVRAGRLSTRVKVDLPNQKDREEVFHIHIQKAKKNSQKAQNAFNGIDLEALSSITDWFSGADIEEIIRRVIENRAIAEIEWKVCEQKIWVEEISHIIEAYKKEKIKNHRLFETLPDLIEKLSHKETWFIYREVIQWVLNIKIQDELLKHIKKWWMNISELIEILEKKQDTQMGFLTK